MIEAVLLDIAPPCIESVTVSPEVLQLSNTLCIPLRTITAESLLQWLCETLGLYLLLALYQMFRSDAEDTL